MLSKLFSFFRRTRPAFTVEIVNSDADYQAALQLLSEHIDEPTNVPFPPLGGDLNYLGQGVIVGAWDEADLVAAAFVGPDVQTAADAVQFGRPEYETVFRRRIAVVHGIATRPESRHKGAATAVLNWIASLATEEEYDVLLSVPTTTQSQQLFAKCGYCVFDTDVALMLQPKESDSPIAIPNFDFRWAVGFLTEADRAHIRVGQALIPTGASENSVAAIQARWLS
nr:GNAT family N-acetyltransferase [Corynebacterium lactis]